MNEKAYMGEFHILSFILKYIFKVFPSVYVNLTEFYFSLKKKRKVFSCVFRCSSISRTEVYGRRLSPCLSWDISPLILENSPYGHFASVSQMHRGLPFPYGVLCRIYRGAFRE